MPPSYLPTSSRRSSKLRNWTNYPHLSARKKQNLPDYGGGSANILYFGLESSAGRNAETIQQLVDEARKAKEYFSDGWDAYAMLWYHLATIRFLWENPRPILW